MENKTIAILEELWRYEKTTKYTDEEIRKALDEAIQALKETEKTEETEYGENIFKEYYPYLGAVETCKEDLMRHFKCFLDFPEHCGVFNINHKVKVKLTDHGEKVLSAYLKAFERYLPNNYDAAYKTDAAGYKTFQMWDLMNIFGEHIFPGAPICFENNEIIFSEKDLH